ncbi:MAG TPA: phosphodiester glycosidase family protein [Streptosporangiaceae bacterium]|nr:phosphodiester glycosidase family protein [Streptosporangiaceae bacterium]
MTVAVFRGPVHYVLHNGSADPGPAAAGLVRAGPAVTGAERGRLLAAFNGGFKLSAGAGGYEQEGHVISPLGSGFASLVIDRSGRARIGVWGHGVPAPGEAVYSVRQNLKLLVEHGRPTPAEADWGLWGATLGGGEYVARSALGQDSSRELIYAASMSATPADLAYALARSGARIAMELDINPEWVQLDTARRPGGPLIAAVPGQNRPADQYLIGWTRDFITVLAPAAGPQATAPPVSSRLRP